MDCPFWIEDYLVTHDSRSTIPYTRNLLLKRRYTWWNTATRVPVKSAPRLRSEFSPSRFISDHIFQITHCLGNGVEGPADLVGGRVAERSSQENEK